MTVSFFELHSLAVLLSRSLPQHVPLQSVLWGKNTVSVLSQPHPAVLPTAPWCPICHSQHRLHPWLTLPVHYLHPLHPVQLSWFPVAYTSPFPACQLPYEKCSLHVYKKIYYNFFYKSIYNHICVITVLSWNIPCSVPSLLLSLPETYISEKSFPEWN